MTILGPLLERSGNLQDPTIPIVPSSLAWILDGNSTSAGELVTESTAYGLTAYYRAMAILGSTIAGLPLHVYQRGTKTKVGNRTVLQSPNPRHNTPFKFWQTMVINGAGHGRMFAQKIRNGADVITELWPIHPSKVRVLEVPRSTVAPDGLGFVVTDSAGEQQALTSWEILHIPYMSPDGITGLSPLRCAAEALGTGIAAEKSAGSFFANGSQLDGYLKTDADLTQEQSEQLQAWWTAKTSGPSRAGRTAVLDNGAEFHPITVSPKDAELLASRKWTVTEVARMFGIPPWMLGDIEKTTSWGTGIEQQMIGFVKFTLKPWLDLIEQSVTAEVLPGGVTSGSWYAKWSVEGLLRGDSVARAALYASGIQNGWLNRNEPREWEDLEPQEGLDEFLAPANLAMVNPDGTFTPLVPLNTTPDPEPTSGDAEADEESEDDE